MNKKQLRVCGAVLGGLLLLPVAAAIVIPGLIRDIHRIDVARVGAVARELPAFTVEQRMAVLREIRTEQNPKWQSLAPSARAERIAALAALWLRQKASGTNTAAPALAPFQGNLTFLINPSGSAVGLLRQSDCSLTLYDADLNFSTNGWGVGISQTTPHYEQSLHAAAGLATQADVFATGCADPMLGIGSRGFAYLGLTSQGTLFGAATAYDDSQNANGLYWGTFDTVSSAVTVSGPDLSLPGMVNLTAGDLNGDGVADVVGLDQASGDIEVWLAKSDGTFNSPTHYTLGGTTTEGAVIADVNGDGKLDVVVATRDASNQEQLWVLTGDGTGSLTVGQPQSIPTITDSRNVSHYMGTMVAADLRASGHQDLIGANGLVLLNDGSGNFSAVSQPAFSATVSTSDYGPNVAVGDFNNDGKLDVAMDDGEAIHISLGKGDGTFTPGPAYASDSDVGYLTATDLDGDGNADLYVGIANGGLFGGDQFGTNQAYAVLGHGDGTFTGAPYVPFVYTGTNLADLNGDGHIDAVGLNSDRSFTSYLGDGKGGFTTQSTLQTSPFTYNGTQYPLDSIDSFDIADVNGDGHPDIVFLDARLVVQPPQGFDTGGFLIALGDGTGGFATPTFFASGHFVPGNDVDLNPTLSSLRLADINHDGKADLVFSFSDEDYTTGTNYQGIAVQLGNGDGTFQPPQMLLFPYDSTATYRAIDFTDFNHDGNPDLLFTTAHLDATSNTIQYGLEIALGHGDGTFGTPSPVATVDVMGTDVFSGTQYAPVVVADMNGDGIPDIVVLGEAADSSNSMQIAIALGNGDGTFKTPSKTTFANSYGFETLAVADFNGDGKLDVAIAGSQPPIDTGIVFGNGDGTLQPLSGANGLEPNEVFYLSMLGAAIAYDFNGDGKPDLLAGQTVLLNLGAVVSSGDFALSANPTSLTVSAGQSTTTTLTVTPSGGFNQQIAFSCSGLPQGASCSFSPSTVTPSGSAVNVTLTIAAASQSGMLWFGGMGSTLASFGYVLVWRRKRRHPRPSSLMAFIPAALLCATFLVACGSDGSSGGSGSSTSSSASSSSSSSASSTSSSSSSSATASTVTVTATAGSGASVVQHTIQIQLTGG